jgi:hypothetical protein
MRQSSILQIVTITAFGLLPAAVLLFFAYSVWLDRVRNQLPHYRRLIFGVAMLLAVTVTVMVAVWSVGFHGSNEIVNGLWLFWK